MCLILAYGPKHNRKKRENTTIIPGDPGYLALTLYMLPDYTAVKKHSKFFDQKGQNRKVDMVGMQLNLDGAGAIRVRDIPEAII